MMQADVGSGFLTAAFSLVQNQFLIMAGIKLWKEKKSHTRQ